MASYSHISTVPLKIQATFQFSGQAVFYNGAESGIDFQISSVTFRPVLPKDVLLEDLVLYLLTRLLAVQ